MESNAAADLAPKKRITHIAVFLITLSGLIFEIGLTRIYSASIWYHFAFVAISVALLGWGLGVLTVHVLMERVRLSMEGAVLVTLIYAGCVPALCFLFFAFFTSLFSTIIPLFAILFPTL